MSFLRYLPPLFLRYREDHPDLYQDLEAEKADKKYSSGIRVSNAIAGSPGGPPKTTSPMQLYIEAKTEEHRKKDPSVSVVIDNLLHRENGKKENKVYTRILVCKS